MHYPYDAFLRGTGLTVKFLRLNWFTTAFNRTIVKWGTAYPRLFSHSFDIGVYISVFLLPFAVFVVFISSIIDTNGGSVKLPENFEAPRLEIVLPGINLPTDEIGFYVAALLVCSVVHELGHAIAGVLEDVPVTGFGILVFFMLPVAYTGLSTDHINSLKMWKKLKVFCAGIWNNIILSAFAYILLLILPILMTPMFSLNSSVIVTDVMESSPIFGIKGLMPNDVITEINSCKVKNWDSWFDCLIETIKYQPAYCISADFVHQNEESIPIIHSNSGSIECCDSKNKANSCFEYMTDDSENELPQHMCLNVRKTIEHSTDYCHKTVKCPSGFCIKPLMNNATTIIHIKRGSTPDIIYMGQPGDISRTVKISEFVPKTNLLGPSFGDTIFLFLKYIVVFSSGLAVLNLMPCFGFDGQHILSTILNHFLAKIVPQKSKRELISLCFTVVGTILIFITFIKAIWTSILAKLF